MKGTVVRDVIEYDVGFGWLGEMAQRIFVGRQLQRTFEYRQKALEKLLSSHGPCGDGSLSWRLRGTRPGEQGSAGFLTLDH